MITVEPLEDVGEKPSAQPHHGPRAKKVMTKIMDAAERLIALYGVEGVSFRQILIEAKQRNKYAISLYFGGKDELLTAIVSRRVTEMNVRRKVLVAEAEARGTMNDPRTLLEITYRPLAEVSDATGEYTYARFLHQALLYRTFNYNWPALSPEVAEFSHSANRRLRALVPDMPDAFFYRRVEAIAGLYLSSMSARALRVSSGRPTMPFATFFDDLMDMMTAVFLTKAGATRMHDGEEWS
jgi:AcrR family transcriptional regulator